jgi:MoaA/NifB/PqqE/SkfB family radical SAM enzyme
MSMLLRLREQKLLMNVLNDLDPKLATVFLPWALRHPRYLRTFYRIVSAYRQTKQLREKAMLSGLKIPPFLILSITSRCNLHCAECYATATSITNDFASSDVGQTHSVLNWEQWRAIISEASELGVLGFIIAGGEPFLFPRMLELCNEFKNRLFIIVTNGTVISETDFKQMKQLSNIAVLVSIEGGKDITDSRRGTGVHEKALDTLRQLNKLGVLTGISVTINRSNYEYWMNSKYIDDFISLGIRIGVFTEIIPINTRGITLHMLTNEERAAFRSQILTYRATKPLYLIHSPGDEEYFGGCVSAGRGFAHITPTGELTPCPVSNIATHNLTTSSLKEGLASPLFVAIRENEHLLETNGVPCALFGHPKEIEVIVDTVGAYQTNNT